MSTSERGIESNSPIWLKYLANDENDFLIPSPEKIQKWEQEGKLYIGGRQFVSPQAYKVVQGCLENVKSPLVTGGQNTSVHLPLHSHQNNSMRNNEGRYAGQSVNISEEAMSDDSMTNNFDELENQQNSNQDPISTLVSPASKCPIDKVPEAKDDPAGCQEKREAENAGAGEEIYRY